jgi:peroxiredoxin (alkyl hydroperoxide reductase subunit C)
MEEMNVMPRIGELAPEFEAVTTQGKINFPADFKGKWLIGSFVLGSYPKRMLKAN